MSRILAFCTVVAVFALPATTMADNVTLQEPGLPCDHQRTGPPVSMAEVHKSGGPNPNVVYSSHEWRNWRSTSGDPAEAQEKDRLRFEANLVYAWNGHANNHSNVRSAPQKPYYAGGVSASANQPFTATVSMSFRTCRHGKPVMLGKPIEETMTAVEPTAEGLQSEIPGEHYTTQIIEGSFPYADVAATRLIKKGVLLVLSYLFKMEGGNAFSYTEQMALKLVSKHVPRT